MFGAGFKKLVTIRHAKWTTLRLLSKGKSEGKMKFSILLATVGTIAVAGAMTASADCPTPQALSACKDLEPAGFTGSTRSAQQQKAGIQFAQCIREHGVADFPDPTPDGPLVDTNRIPSAATVSGISILNAAMRECGSFARAAGVTGGK